MKILREDKLINVNVDEDANHNKFYHIIQYEDFSLRMEWGRVDSGSQTQEKSFPSQSASDKIYDKKVAEKLKGKLNKKTGQREPYTKVDILSGTSGKSSAKQSTISGEKVKNIAKNQIKTDSTIVSNLIDYLVKVNIHTITSESNITYDVDTGLFATPLGVRFHLIKYMMSIRMKAIKQ